MAQLGTHKLLYPIMLETRDPDSAETKQEELKPAGFCVVLRRPKAKDLKVFDSFGERHMAATMSLIERISNLDEIEVENLDGEDFEKLGNLVAPDSAHGQTTGATG